MNRGEMLLDAVREHMDECGTPDVTETVRVHVGGATYILRPLTEERAAAIVVWRRSHRKDIRGLYARLLVGSLVTADGSMLFEAGDLASVAQWPPMVLEHLVAAVVKLNRMGRRRAGLHPAADRSC